MLLAVDPTPEVAREAVDWGADLLVTHHPLFLAGVHGVAATTPKGRTLHTLLTGGCALLTAHTNADQASGGVSESLALALGLTDLAPILPAEDGAPTGTGRIGSVAPTTLRGFAEHVASVLPATAHGVRVSGDPDRPVRRVALCGGAGDFLLDRLAGVGRRRLPHQRPAAPPRGGVPRARRARPGRRRPLGGRVDVAAGGAGPPRRRAGR